MPFDPRQPDLAVIVPLDRYAPRSARQCVAQVDSPSPDLRDAVVLLCSELVTQAVERSSGSTVEVRVWMPQDVVRVELLGSRQQVPPLAGDRPDYATLLLEQIADRWELEDDEDSTRVWFEIDRHAARAPMANVY